MRTHWIAALGLIAVTAGFISALGSTNLSKATTFRCSQSKDTKEVSVKELRSPDGDWVAVSEVPTGMDSSGSVLILCREQDRLRVKHDLTFGLRTNSANGSVSKMVSNLQAGASIYMERGIWSKNSRYYAFSGASAGPTADVYVFDTEDQKFKRLSDGPTQIFGLNWAPDDRWIAYIGVNNFGTGAGRNDDAVWLASPSGKRAKLLYRPPKAYMITNLKWLDNNTVIIESGVIKPGVPSIRVLVNIEE